MSDWGSIANKSVCMSFSILSKACLFTTTTKVFRLFSNIFQNYPNAFHKFPQLFFEIDNKIYHTFLKIFSNFFTFLSTSSSCGGTFMLKIESIRWQNQRWSKKSFPCYSELYGILNKKILVREITLLQNSFTKTFNC